MTDELNERANFATHDLYGEKDRDAPDAVRLGGLAVCKRCAGAEAELYDQKCDERLLGIAALALKRHDALQQELRVASITVDDIVKRIAAARGITFLRREAVRIEVMAREALKLKPIELDMRHLKSKF